jgi:hypothetical protein
MSDLVYWACCQDVEYLVEAALLQQLNVIHLLHSLSMTFMELPLLSNHLLKALLAPEPS